MGELVRASTERGITTITLDSQHNRNALSRQLLAELQGGLDLADRDRARAVVIRHEGPAFCAGADLKERSSDGPSDGSPFVDVMERLMDMPRPTIAAVDGAVRAGGIGLMASCDLVVVNSSTTFALTEVRIGVAIAMISVPILRRVPAAKLAAPALTGAPFDADEARRMGLVTHVTDDVTATVASICDGVLAGAERAVAHTKAILATVPELDRTTAFEQMTALSNELFRGPDAAEGMAAFREKRLPNWHPDA
jgi:enoyl-CoA hydratase